MICTSNWEMDHASSFIPRLLPAISVTSCTYVTGRLWRSYEHNYRTMQAFRGPIETADCSKWNFASTKIQHKNNNFSSCYVDLLSRVQLTHYSHYRLPPGFTSFYFHCNMSCPITHITDFHRVLLLFTFTVTWAALLLTLQTSTGFYFFLLSL